MAYIGKEPIVGNFQKCDAITVVNGQAAYTLQVSSTNVVPESANHMLVSLNGILQAPVTSFTVSSSTLTFASNLATGDVIDFVILLGNVLDLGTPSDGTVTNAKLSGDLISGETDIGGAIADADLFLLDDGAGGTLRKTAASRIKTYAGGAIAHAGMWRITANFTGNSSPISSNWEESDNKYSRVGSAMSVSSGIWTFPETGVWLITFQARCIRTGTFAYYEGTIYGTHNDSAYTTLSANTVGQTTSSSTQYRGFFMNAIFDVTDLSNDKVKFGVSSDDSSVVTNGDSTGNLTGVTFIRLGDT